MKTAELVAGRELDAMIAERVMGWEPYSGGYYYGKDGHLLACMAPNDSGAPHFSPSTDIAAAWLLVERAIHSGLSFSIWADGHIDGGNLHANWGGYKNEAVASTAPLAICGAALAAVGG